MMLRWGLVEAEAADLIEEAVRKTLDAGYRTPDIASGDESEIIVDTNKMTGSVLSAIG